MHHDDDGGYGGPGGPGGPGGGGGKRPRQVSNDPDHVELRVLIPSKSAGAIIGKGGENIKSLRSQYNASVNIPDSNSPERILYISADYRNACDCLRDILPKIEEPRGSRGDVEVRVLVHQSQAGAIIGRAGFKIKELREATGTGIKVFAECAPASTDRLVQVNGEPEKCAHAVREVLQICMETPIKGPTKPYDTINYDPNLINDYGGFPPDRSWRGPTGGRGGRGGGGGGGGGGGPGYMPPRGQMQNMRGGPPGGGYPDPYGGGYDMPPMNPGMGRGGPPGPPMMPDQGYGQGGPSQTSQVTIPKDLAGTIIGKGGERINRIREDSGAHIVVDPPAPGSDERIISITGNPHQIQMAQYLLQQCVRSSAAGRRYIQNQSLQ